MHLFPNKSGLVSHESLQSNEGKRSKDGPVQTEAKRLCRKTLENV